MYEEKGKKWDFYARLHQSKRRWWRPDAHKKVLSAKIQSFALMFHPYIPLSVCIGHSRFIIICHVVMSTKAENAAWGRKGTHARHDERLLALKHPHFSLIRTMPLHVMRHPHILYAETWQSESRKHPGRKYFHFFSTLCQLSIKHKASFLHSFFSSAATNIEKNNAQEIILFISAKLNMQPLEKYTALSHARSPTLNRFELCRAYFDKCILLHRHC